MTFAKTYVRKKTLAAQKKEEAEAAQDAEAEASDNCVLYWLSTRLDIQTVNLATASLPTHQVDIVLILFHIIHQLRGLGLRRWEEDKDLFSSSSDNGMGIFVLWVKKLALMSYQE